MIEIKNIIMGLIEIMLRLIGGKERASIFLPEMKKSAFNHKKTWKPPKQEPFYKITIPYSVKVHHESQGKTGEPSPGERD